MNIRVLIVDHDERWRKRLTGFLKTAPDVEIVGCSAGGRVAASMLTRWAPDVVFLDAQDRQEPGGLDLLAVLDQVHPPLIVLMAASDQHAVQAFEIGAVDYVIKPFDSGRIEAAFSRVRKRLPAKHGEYAARLLSLIEHTDPRLIENAGGFSAARKADSSQSTHLERIMVKDKGRVYFLRPSDIYWVESADNYVRVHAGKSSHLVRRTLTSFYADLDSSRFIRVHRTAVVNLDKVREIHQGVGSDKIVVLDDGTEIKLSDRYRRRMERRSRGGR